MANTCEPLINVVTGNKPKVLTRPARANRLEPKGMGSGPGVPNSPGADGAPPAKRRSLTHAGTYTQRGKPVGLPARESEPQGTPIGLRVEDGGESEGPLVMRGIGVEPLATSPHAKAGRLPSRSLITREFGEPL